MTTTTLIPRGADLLAADGVAAEGERKTCLVCAHYQVRLGGCLLLCTKRKQTRQKMASWRDGDYDRAIARATRCRDFEDMRP
jgi:hypothetical protein